jgi:hypothetical protein
MVAEPTGGSCNTAQKRGSMTHPPQERQPEVVGCIHWYKQRQVQHSHQQHHQNCYVYPEACPTDDSRSICFPVCSSSLGVPSTRACDSVVQPAAEVSAAAVNEGCQVLPNAGFVGFSAQFTLKLLAFPHPGPEAFQVGVLDCAITAAGLHKVILVVC